MASIREVAKLAGVSPSTVSRVMNNTANVDAEKKKRVLDAIEKTGFKPNELARALFKQSSKIIGVIVPSIDNPFFSEMSKAIEEKAFEKGFRILLCNSNGNPEKEKMNIEMLTQMKADGLIVMTNSEKTGEVIAECKIPVVVLDRLIDGESVIANISSDNYKGAVLAAEHLIECGCRNIVCIRGPLAFSSGRERYRGYQDVCKKHNLKEQCVDSIYSYDAGLEAAREILRRYPEVDGIIACNDMVAMSVYKVIQGEGYRVPEDIQIIGFDNIYFSKLFTPEITTIKQPIKEMGELAINTIIDHIDGKEVKKSNIFDIELLERQSTKKSHLI